MHGDVEPELVPRCAEVLDQLPREGVLGRDRVSEGEERVVCRLVRVLRHEP